MSTTQKRFWLIIFLTALAIFIDLPSQIKVDQKIFSKPVKFSYSRPDLNINLGKFKLQRDFKTHLGLDLAGGTRLTLQADMSQIDPADRPDALASTRQIISDRVDLFGISEPNIYTQKSADTYQIITELPGLTDTAQAARLIGTTAQLEFRTPIYSQPSTPSGQVATVAAQPQIAGFKKTDLTGKFLKKTSVTFQTQDANPAVQLQFDQDGAQKFTRLTQENLNKPLAIFLDDRLLTAPVVQEVIENGQAVISGQFTTQQARNLSIQLNAGALPVPIKIVSQTNVPPTLGRISIQESLLAGAIGLTLVMAFMIAFYGHLGLLADISLIIYGLLTLALYKLIPVTLTLPGIAGFILSIGMAVDSNILIFERYRQELTNRRWSVAMELGFGRAWDAIKDANLATLLTAFILFNPLNWSFLITSGPVRGFALTLSVGVLTSLFTGIVVTRTLIRLFYQGPKNNQK